MSSPSTPVKYDMKNALSLRVVQITHPSLNQQSHSTQLDPRDLPKTLTLSQDGFNKIIENPGDDAQPGDVMNQYLDNFLTLSKKQGTIYVGESFRFYVQCSNDSELTIAKVALNVEIQNVSNRKVVLMNTTDNPTEELLPRKTIDHVLSYRMTENSLHYLVCKVNFSLPNGKSETIKKVFKIPVVKAVDIKSEIILHQSGYLAKMVVKNESTESIFIESAKMNVNESEFSLTDIHASSNTPRDPLSIHGLNYQCMNPKEQLQYLFYIEPKLNSKSNYETLLGHMVLKWRSSTGESGFHVSEGVHSPKSILRRPIALNVNDVPDVIYHKTPFKIQFIIKNESNNAIRPVLKPLRKPSNVVFHGLSNLKLPQIQPNASHKFEIQFLSLEAGIQDIGNIVVTDKVSEKSYEFYRIGNIMVEKC